MFEIRLNRNSEIHYEEKGCFGFITINDFYERFFSPIDFWDRDKYLENWYKELNKLINGFSCAKLITKIYNPDYMNFLQAWILYKVDNTVFIQEQFFLVEELPKPFSLENFYLKELERETKSEDGEEISEWKIDISDIKLFLSKIELKVKNVNLSLLQPIKNTNIIENSFPELLFDDIDESIEEMNLKYNNTLLSNFETILSTDDERIELLSDNYYMKLQESKYIDFM